MRTIFIFVLTGMAAVSPAAARSVCGPISVPAHVEVAAGDFTAADLLPPGTCPVLVQAAAHVRLGSAPLEGSVRVMRGEEIRALFNKLRSSLEGSDASLGPVNVPERITVRRSGARESCGEISERLFAVTTAMTRAMTGPIPIRDSDCGAAGRISRDAALVIAKKAWDPALESWNVWAQCLRPTDCVPFLVRVKKQSPVADMVASTSPGGGGIANPSFANPAFAKPSLANQSTTGSRALDQTAVRAEPKAYLMRPGERASLLWDGDGILLVASVICLDRAGPGEPVRARMVRGGRVVRAIVVRAGVLRVAS
jgi:hypothetical protein